MFSSIQDTVKEIIDLTMEDKAVGKGNKKPDLNIEDDGAVGKEHTKKKRARLGISRKDCSAAIDSFRQHVNEGFQASAEVPAIGEDTDMTDINNFVADV